MRTSRLACLVVAGLMLLLTSQYAHAKGKLDTIRSFQSSNVHLDVDTYTDGPARVAVLGMATQSVRTSFAFGKDQVPRFVELMDKAFEAARGESEEWQEVGSMEETGTDEMCALTIEAGPSIRLTIKSAKTDTNVVFLIPKEELPAFESAIKKMVAYVSG